MCDKLVHLSFISGLVLFFLKSLFTKFSPAKEKLGVFGYKYEAHKEIY